MGIQITLSADQVRSIYAQQGIILPAAATTPGANVQTNQPIRPVSIEGQQVTYTNAAAPRFLKDGRTPALLPGTTATGQSGYILGLGYNALYLPWDSIVSQCTRPAKNGIPGWYWITKDFSGAPRWVKNPAFDGIQVQLPGVGYYFVSKTLKTSASYQGGAAQAPQVNIFYVYPGKYGLPISGGVNE